MRKLIKRLLVLIVICTLSLICIVLGAGYLNYRRDIEETPIQTRIDTLRATKSYTKFHDISPVFLDSMVAIEDRRFYSHGAVDIISIGRALYTNLKHWDIVQGGSTITQQLAKNLFLDHNQSITRKAEELFYALAIERNYTKDTILELYVNAIYYGDGYTGISAASYGYFDKAPKDLTYDEATLLAGLPNAPSVYELSNGTKLAEKRREYVVRALENYKKTAQSTKVLSDN